MEERNDLVTYDQAEKLHKLGFSKKCTNVYFNGELIDWKDQDNQYIGDWFDNKSNCVFSAPTVDEAAKWIRVNMQIHVSVVPMPDMHNKKMFWTFNLYNVGDVCENFVHEAHFCDTYEEAMRAGISDAFHPIRIRISDEERR